MVAPNPGDPAGMGGYLDRRLADRVGDLGHRVGVGSMMRIRVPGRALRISSARVSAATPPPTMVTSWSAAARSRLPTVESLFSAPAPPVSPGPIATAALARPHVPL